MLFRTSSRFIFNKLSTKSFSVEITAAMVKELRNLSGAPMMECKKALAQEEVQGNIAKAVDWLRAKGIAKATSSNNRVAVEGLLAIYASENKIGIVEINSETDFVSRNAIFQHFSGVAAMNASKFAAGNISISDLLNSTPSIQRTGSNNNASSLQEVLGDVVTCIRENISIKRALSIEWDPSSQIYGVYIHGKERADELALPESIQLGRQIGIVELNYKSTNQEGIEPVTNAAKRLAMHVVAAKPSYLSIEDVPVNEVQTETEICREQALSAPVKNEAMLEKIIAGKVNKNLGEKCLLSQMHMAEEGSPIIKNFIKNLEKSSKIETIEVKKFHRWVLGE